MTKKENLPFKGEIIGFTIEVVEAENKQIQGLRGKVVDETANTIVIEHDDREIKILKDQILKLEIIELSIRVAGHVLKGRPEERIKR